MKQVNKDGPRILGPELPGQRRWNATQVHQRVCDECLVLDTRSKGAFAASHIPEAINIPFGPNLPGWVFNVIGGMSAWKAAQLPIRPFRG